MTTSKDLFLKKKKIQQIGIKNKGTKNKCFFSSYFRNKISYF